MTGWTLLPTIVVRSAGFPWLLVDSLGWPETARSADQVTALLSAVEEMQDGLPRGRLTRGQSARLRNHRQLEAGAPVPAGWLRKWNELTAALAAEQGLLCVEATQDADNVDKALGELTADPRFLDAVACCSPGVYRDLANSPGLAASARIRRQVASYVQRFAAKCETMSFFGPINYAEVDLELPATSIGWAGHTACADRRAYVSAWIWNGLRDSVLADPGQASGLIPRTKTLARPAAALGEDRAAHDVHAAADGHRSLLRIAELTGLDLAAATAGLAAGMNRGVLACEGLPDDTEPDPVRWFAAQAFTAQASRDAAVAVIELLDRYPAAHPGTKLEIISALPRIAMPEPAEQAAARGKFYNDRSPVHEAAVGTLSLRVGGGLAYDLSSRVPEAIGLLAHAAVRTRMLTNTAVARGLGPGRFALARVIRDCAGLAIPQDPWLVTELGRAVAAAAVADDVDLTMTMAPPPAPDLPVLCSVDALVAIDDLARYRQGETLLVLGDIHDAPLITPWALQFHPDADSVLARRDQAIEDALGDIRVVCTVARRSTGLPPLRFPGLLLELGAVGGDAQRVRLDELYVDSDGERARLRAVGIAAELYFHNGELDSAVHTAFALPRVRPPVLPAGPRVPRLRWGNVVVSRRLWRLDAGELRECGRPTSPAARLVALRAYTRRLGLPSEFFAKAPHERKPIYVDTASPLLSDGLWRLARAADRVDATEVLPASDQLWLRDGDASFAAELRCVYLRRWAGR